MNPLHYIFFRIYLFQKEIGITKFPHLSAISAQAFCLLMNILTIINFLQVKYNFKISFILIAILTVVLVNIYYFRKAKYRVIIKQYSKKVNNNFIADILLIAYLILTVLLLFYSSKQVRISKGIY